MHLSSNLILGIETSCDETAAAVIALKTGGTAEIRSGIVLGQADAHRAFGGVVPEIAARAHVEALDDVVAAALKEADAAISDLSGVAVTSGPGLMGGLLVGLMTAKGIAAAADIPMIGVNHLEGHALTPRLTENVEFPYLLLLCSGGHTQVLLVENEGRYRRLGTTIDDALGEAFDKTAKLLGLGFPGGPAVECTAENGDPGRFSFPMPLQHRPGCDFSFSGLKTAVRMTAEARAPLDDRTVADIAASFQKTACEATVARLRNAFKFLDDEGIAITAFAAAGGVAANRQLRAQLEGLADDNGVAFVAPPLDLCGDNAVMIAYAGGLRLLEGEYSSMSLAPRARWPLDEGAAPRMGSGKAGVKV